MVMGVPVGLLGAVKALVRWADADRTPKARLRVPKWSAAVPKTWIAYRDPSGRFTLYYPTGWELQWSSDTIQGLFSRIGFFVRVDAGVDEDAFWKSLNRPLEEVGGKLKIDRHTNRSARGRYLIGKGEFEWESTFCPTSRGVVVLSTGNVVDSRRGPSVEAYEDAVLERIRRHFVVWRRIKR
ncbi:MAG TPA: hypothetical protein VI643_06380 [Planctomycetota bacterium]|nr:hypothetical protein [Planctomycetota bacterium]